MSQMQIEKVRLIRNLHMTEGTNGQPPSPAAIHFFVYPIYGGEGGEQTPPFIFFTPFFVPQENRKHVSESTMKKLPIIEITQQDIDAQATCPICLEAFSLSSTDQESNSLPQTVRQMPCKHTFCESCLFQWLKENNTCPLCRKEIEAEGTPQQPQNEQTAAESTTASSQEDVTMNDASLSTSTDSNSSSASFSHTHSHSHNHHQQQEAPLRCALESVGCCGESQSNEESPTASPLITLPQCHHQFHASCLRTSLIVEGYSFESPNSRPLDFYCPTCRSPAIIQSDVLKTPSVSSPPQEQQRPSLPIVLPLPPDSDVMDLD
ncbi:9468_t:CDS:2 [Acaulospora morrowiae]|uniref:9468_t:CDS:1 n=1 Tax=Acaulospora morrowiae TaxID=94023 RepID=A0A9N9G739_9GLOM|nr:9468_t:CDS:2 [Acaulospora morrowiae]